MPGTADIEDSAYSISVLVAISNAATRRVRRGFSSHFLKWVNARIASHIPANYMREEHRNDPLVQSMQFRKTLNPFAAEFFAQAILRRLKIRTAPQVICTPEEARALPADYVVKIAGEEPAQNLNWKPEMVLRGFCLASRIVPDAASLDFIARTIIPIQDARTQVLRESAISFGEKDTAIEQLIAKTLGKECTQADFFFSEFRPTESEIANIKSAMAIDGPQYLAINAARVFLGCSAPHFSNVLASKDGTLTSIDHARGAFEDGRDLKELFYFVARSSVAFTALGAVARLTEDDIHAAVDEIPVHPACGSTVGLAKYFCERLRLWKNLHAEEMPDSADMTTDPGLTCWNPVALVGREVAESAAAIARGWK
jgi:hypothetical protein